MPKPPRRASLPLPSTSQANPTRGPIASPGLLKACSWYCTIPVERYLLIRADIDAPLIVGLEAAVFDLHAVVSGHQVGEDERAVRKRDEIALLFGEVIDQLDCCAGDDGSGRIGDRSGYLARDALGGRHGDRSQEAQQNRKNSHRVLPEIQRLDLAQSAQAY